MRELEEYLNYLENIRKYSFDTVKSYESDIIQFLDFCDNRNKNFLKIDYNFVREYLRYLKEERSEKSTSVSRKISALRGFYDFLLKEEEDEGVGANYFKLVKLPRKEKKLPRFFSYQELEVMFGIPDKKTPIGQRDALILEMLYATGMRVSELVSVKVDDIDFKRRRIKIMGKGSKERYVFYTDVCENVLNLYLEDGRCEINTRGSKFLFINHLGGVLTPRGVRYILDKIIRQTSISKNISPHMIRHSFATHLLNEGCDLLSVQELLGHESLKATSVYTHITTDRMKDVYLKAHPRARKE